MIFQITEYLRLFIIFVPQIFMIGLFTYVIVKILRRNTNQDSLMLSGFYFCMILGLAMNVIAVVIAFFTPGEFIAILYFLATYITILSFVFVVVFILGLLREALLKSKYTYKKMFAIILTYGIAWLVLHLVPGGVSYSENWAPVYSFPLFIAANALFTVSFTIPITYYSVRMRRGIKDANLKRKFSLFIVGIIMVMILIYGVILYNTWQDPLFKTLWSIPAIVLLISSGSLIYYGIGRDL